MKNLMNLKGAHVLSKNEQQSINGGASCGCSDGSEKTVLNCDWCNIFCNGPTGPQQGWFCVGGGENMQ